MNWTGIAGLLVVILCALLMILFAIRHRSHPLRGLRPIEPLLRFRREVDRAVEDGTRLHVSLGSASLTSPQTAPALVGLSMLDQITQTSALSDLPPIATAGESGL
ncbi:MAG TPA: hypothetical protein VHO48_05150, partial [Anaerolineaceae bacterium]|nr:hypothetical protein [Anaerolineaceae bacterium]